MAGFIEGVIKKSLEVGHSGGLLEGDAEFSSKSFEKNMSSCRPFRFKWNDRISLDSLSRLRAVGSGTLIKVRSGNYADPERYVNDRAYNDVELGKYIDNLLSGEETGYAGNVKMDWKSIREFVPLDGLNSVHYEIPSIWLGPGGSITPLHVDGLDNISFQVQGTKRWLLISPVFYSELRMSSPFEEAPNLHVSALDLRSGTKILEENNVKFDNIDVPEGYGLYVPAGWSHFVETNSLSLMINIWANKLKSRPRILSGLNAKDAVDL